MVDFKALETLVWVATLRSFHRAAVKLNTTQPAVSQRIAQLEADLGKPVVTANQVTMWAALAVAGRKAVGPGQRLLET